ncbi:GTP cyclohydrolase I FolE [Clostridium brassicae]|uniref:GTP cyclohydrolase 1 n=1 Tax=Clostridium brassicae TaxID=2999072 RepID=A0ABT4D5X5_9CLOT|nr:GTP cyclohydrolase I FolE [Clostridium brassicae]MCY6957692.1 GTP cyclohydrolase I FolE [Clostridium brassicae]
MDEIKIKEAVKMIIEAIGEDPEREGLLETPDRIAKMYSEIFSGMNEDPVSHLLKQFSVENDDIILEKDIYFYSMCEHHFLPFYGKAHIAYIPNGKVAGLSKLARTVEVYAKRPQLQERMTAQIADAIMENLDAKGAMIVIEAEHMCMTMRGVKKPGAKTSTIVTRGRFKEDINLRNEVLRLI